MKTNDPVFLTTFWRRYCKMFLAFSWCCGLLSGQLLFLFTGSSARALMYQAVFEAVSFLSLFLSAVLPLFLSAFLLIAFRPYCMVLYCYAEALLYGFIIVGSCVEAGCIGGFVFPLFLTRSFGIMLEYWFWQHYFSGEHSFSFPVLFFLTALAFLGAGIDISIFFPFREFFIV